MNETELRELLELAALAIGRLGPHGNPKLQPENERLLLDGTDWWFWPKGDDWNPHMDDGDSFRLAVALNMEINVRKVVTEATAPDLSMPGELFSCCAVVAVRHGKSGPLKATRMAVLRCAADIGKSMLEKSK